MPIDSATSCAPFAVNSPVQRYFTCRSSEPTLTDPLGHAIVAIAALQMCSVSGLVGGSEDAATGRRWGNSTVELAWHVTVSTQMPGQTVDGKGVLRVTCPFV